MKERDALKAFPRFETDAEAEHFVETADLSEYDLSGFTPTRLAVETTDAHLNMRVPQGLLDAVETKARAQGIPVARYIRLLMERDVFSPP